MKSIGRAVAALVLGASVAGAVLAAEPAAQADAGLAGTSLIGRKAYVQHCASCHGNTLQGEGAVPLTGLTFQVRWAGKDAQELYDAIAKKMPPEKAGSLPEADYRTIYSYMLWVNGFARGGKTIAMADGTSFTMAGASTGPEPKLPAAPQYFGKATTKGPLDADLAKISDGDWPMYNRDYRGHRYSPLDQINTKNVGALAPKCMFQTGELGSFQGSPVLHQNCLYVTTARKTYAIDAVTCKKVWEHEYVPDGPEGMTVNRGVAIYDGKIFRGTPDAHMLAIDAATGATLWDVWVADSRKGYSISAAPAVFAGKVIVGQGGADRGATGHIYAFDANTGKLAWTFNPVPTGKEPGAETWGKGQVHGGGSSWTTIHVDPAARRIYAPIGNPGSSLDGSVRPGANLYTNSVVVLNADNGKLDWYIQQVPHDVWDWDTAAAPVVYDAGGKQHMAVASKDGWMYIYNHKSRELVTRQEISSHFNADKKPTPEGLRVCPGTLGGAEWYGPAFDPKTGTLFLGTVDWCATLSVDTGPRTPFGGTIKIDPASTAYGWLRAFDVNGTPKWTYKAETPVVAGVTPTAGGLVFTGLLNGDFLGFDSANGKVLYRFNTGGAIAGGISSYAIGGKQYVAVASGNTSKTIWATKGAPTVIVFGLP